jgi:CRISPR type III-A-associated RAMP protein Csm5
LICWAIWSLFLSNDYMSYLRIELLTPVHIGTGRKLEPGLDFVSFGAPDHVVAVLDERKVFDIVGADNLGTWLSIINQNGNLLTYLRQRRPQLAASALATRQMDAPEDLPTAGQTVREQMHTGGGEALLAGSSLKGALRTAWLTEKILAQPNESRYALPNGEQALKRNFSDLALTQLHLVPAGTKPGQTPNHDLLRLLQVGDAHFTRTSCLLTETLNETGSGPQMKTSVQQFAECLSAGQSALVRVQVPEALKRELLEKNQVRRSDAQALTLPALLTTVQAQTARLLDLELKRYQPKDLSRAERGAGIFVEELQRLLLQNAACVPGQSAVLRLGFGSGHGFITGGWYEEVLRDHPQAKHDIENAARKNNRYEGWALSKTRKMTLGGVPLGFVRLTLLSDAEVAAEAIRAQTEAAAQAIAQAKAAAELNANRLAAEQAAEAAKQPQYYQGKLKVGTELDAVVEKFAAPNLALRLYLGGEGQEQRISLRYPAGLPVGSVVVVRVQSEQKGRVQNVALIRIKNQPT